MKPLLHVLLAGLWLVSTTASAQASLLDEGFEGSSLPAGWQMSNFSTNPASQAWFLPQVTPDTFAAQAGTPGSYLATSVFVGATDGSDNPTGKIDAILSTPLVAMSEATVLNFWTRTVSGNAFGETLRVGAIVAGSFVELMTINPTIAVGAYAETWAKYTVTLPAQGEGVNGRFYFEYLVPDARVAGNFIGLDSVSVTAVPEPPVGLLMLAGGLVLLSLQSRRRC